MAETKSFNEKFIELMASELIGITVANNYYITVNEFQKYIPNFEEGKTFNDVIAYAKVNDENYTESIADKFQLFNDVEIELGIIYKTDLTNIETDKENIKKSIKKYLTNNTTIKQLRGYDAYYISRTQPIIKWYENIIDKSRMLVEFKFKIKTRII